jgi:Helix-turn-helix domain/MarR family
MPGGRLTYEDREKIATGLTEGLGYAVIARQLGRPTSTVSREVSRNLGPDGGYRPDRAHRATQQRARRDKLNKPVPAPVNDDVYGRDPLAVRKFSEQLAELMVMTGMPRMTARVFVCLYVTDSGTLSAAELVGRLQVSPASISASIGYLEGLGLIRRERDPNRRRELYVADDDIWLRSLLADTKANGSWSATARRGVEVFGAATPVGHRLEEMGQFFDYLTEVLVTAIERWHERQASTVA